ncbi:MAG TPA: hypothetical protein VFH45_03665 [Acidimicrobiales bacterium]|nr:hypothetical protein [Acidimicrobiales bacterium]
MVIDIRTFRLVDGADESAFLAADQRAQVEFFSPMAGIVRRTTARGAAGDWLIDTRWWSADDADAAASAAASDPAVAELEAFIDPSSVTAGRYEALPG